MWAEDAPRGDACGGYGDGDGEASSQLARKREHACVSVDVVGAQSSIQIYFWCTGWEAMKRRCKPFRWLRLWINHWCSPCRSALGCAN